MEGLQGTWKNQVHEASGNRIYPAVFTSRATQGLLQDPVLWNLSIQKPE